MAELSDLPVPLRGRESECTHIAGVLDSTGRGARSVIMIAGGSGIGKTHLLRTALAGAAGSGTSVATVLDGADLGPDTYRPAAVRGFLDESLSPEGRDRPRVVAVDNVDRADTERLESLVNTTIGGRGPGVLLMLAGRSTSGGTAVEWFRSHASADIITISLGPLAGAAVRDVIADRAGARPSAALAAFAEQANGNPRLVSELLAGLREEGRLYLANGLAHHTGTHTPDRAKVLVRCRLVQLSLNCRQLLQVASVLGQTLDLDRIAATLHETTASTLPILEEAIWSEIVTVRGDRLVFQSPLVWRAVQDTVPVPVRMALERESAAERPNTDLADPLPEHPPAPRPAAACPSERSLEGDAPVPHLSRLSDGERTIAELVSEGLTNRQIAAQVYLSPHTVNYHLRRIFRKLNIGSRVELATLAKSNDD